MGDKETKKEVSISMEDEIYIKCGKLTFNEDTPIKEETEVDDDFDGFLEVKDRVIVWELKRKLIQETK